MAVQCPHKCTAADHCVLCHLPLSVRSSRWALLQDCDTVNKYYYIVSRQNYPGTLLCLTGVASNTTYPVQARLRAR